MTSSPAASSTTARTRPLRPTVHCPTCGSNRVHRSRRRSIYDHFLARLGAHLRRCHDCRTRRAWFGILPLPLWDANSVGAKLTGLSLIGSGLLACLLLVWWMIQRIKIGSG
jgi:hypothetical protein